MSHLTIINEAHPDRLKFHGEIEMAPLNHSPYTKLCLRVAELPGATIGDKLRALASLFDEREPVAHELTGVEAEQAWAAATRPGGL